jgi:hypothetical protein
VRALSVSCFSAGARGADKAQSIKVPLDGLKTAAELISSAVDYGAEEVDPEMSVENVQVVYVDRSGKTKPVGSKTALSLLKKARKVRISPVGVPLRASVEKVRPSSAPARLSPPPLTGRMQRASMWARRAGTGSIIRRQGAQEEAEEGNENATRSQAAEARER